MIFCNGVPKNGTNLLLKICGFLEFTDAQYFILSNPDGSFRARRQHLGEKEHINPSMVFIRDNGYFCHSHVLHEPKLYNDHKVITIFRDPRNALVSAMRYKPAPQTKGGEYYFRGKYKLSGKHRILDLIRNGYNKFPTWADYTRAFLPWLKHGLPVRFETINTINTLKAIRDYLGADGDVDYLSGHLIGNGKEIDNRPMYAADSTWSGELSDWHDYWDDEIQAAFEETGCHTLLKELGYAR